MKVPVAEQLFISVIVNWYAPATKAKAVSLFGAPLLQTKLNPPLPPDGTIPISPLFPPKQLTGLIALVNVMAVGCVRTTVSDPTPVSYTHLQFPGNRKKAIGRITE